VGLWVVVVGGVATHTHTQEIVNPKNVNAQCQKKNAEYGTGYRVLKNLECSRYYQKEPLPIQFSVPGHTRLYREVNINQYRVTHEKCHPSAKEKKYSSMKSFLI
jgi:hypothetical protein